MMDRIESLAHILRKWHNIHTIDRDIKKLLVRQGIIENHSKVHSTCMKRNTPDCTFAANIAAKDSVFNKAITIIIKPDHSDKRCLRVLIQIGGRVFQNLEEKDNPKWGDKKIFRKELRDAEKDIVETMKKLKAA